MKFLPPYSPFLNAIENVFSAVKAFIKRELAARRLEFYQLMECARVLGESLAEVRRNFVVEIIERSLNEVITPALVQNCDLHVVNYIPACIDEQPIAG